MLAKKLPPAEELRNKLRYDPQTGYIHSVKTNRRVFTNKHHSGYLKGAIDGRTFTAHRVAMALHLGYWPEGEIDHINGNKSDNFLTNLRIVDRSQNQRNCRRRKDNTSGHVGVFERPQGTWQAYISHGGQKLYLGTFQSKKEAIAARLSAQKRYGYSDRHGS